ncbi:hypothetical protein [Bacillus inaquosorum]|uniref:hypothetical protein n=1 Tax=Bacillus inaquosorum TaxID=483913 RepID=UPI0022828DAB|nr:hypothetical protein [Bacillus inaquosorum]MCY7950786.1 hypothetical protein [Bacillus inaquosorum]MCY8722195.1 hypothetical protein [Bacillus inaquosorum]MCY8853443.1 hypothetical protein [Bacillus inaquosorum]MCY8997638.1 hypothetical protein [Bacillus inaquosorum]MCY9010878.1 hypothetical protein [Bacillus inaquosorum]
MAKDKQQKKAVHTESRETLFDTADLIKHAKELFGVKPDILQGALFGVDQTRMTKSEANELIQTFLTKEVMSS